jgi:hypothetical protein
MKPGKLGRDAVSFRKAEPTSVKRGKLVWDAASSRKARPAYFWRSKHP